MLYFYNFQILFSRNGIEIYAVTKSFCNFAARKQRKSMIKNYDVLVIGGGHAGCEAACAAANMGAKTCLVTMDMNKIGQMSCNPAVGGIAKGQIVREIDALGGYMGLVTDATAIQFRMLNVGKGPAVWSPRAQCDRGKFIWEWRRTLDGTEHLDIWQDQVEELLVEEVPCTVTPSSSQSIPGAATPSQSVSCAATSSQSQGVPGAATPSEGVSCAATSSQSQGVPGAATPSEGVSCAATSSQSQGVSSSQPAKRVVGVRTIWGCELRARCVVITAGTFLNGLMHIGRKMVKGGRIAEPAAEHLTESITRHGIRSARMKTGTPVRIDKRSVDFSQLRKQEGEQRPYRFSYFPAQAKKGNLGENVNFANNPTGASNEGTNFATAKSETTDKTAGFIEQPALPQLPCWECYTNPAVHEMLRSGLADSPLYNGQIHSIGPRYCPSIETKLVTFPDREQHLLFLEPEGSETNEMYLNGFSSSLPMDVQIAALRLIPGLENARVYRPGYAIEYDYFDPTQLNHTLESKIIDGLFFAGQVNGTTGYEEAAGQGLIAGINAAMKAGAAGSDAGSTTGFTLGRDEAYIGVLIDDLVTKGVDEPYRMFTSRAEYRILLRQDDADARLTERSYRLGLATRARYDHWLKKKENIEGIIDFCKTFPIKAKEINPLLEPLGTTPLQFGVKLEELIARPQLNFKNLQEIIPELKERIQRIDDRRDETAEAAEILIKYKGYIEREKLVADKMHRLENIRIKGHFDYEALNGLSTECRQKLKAIDPETLAQASRIPGVSPSDINVLLVLMGR